MVLVILAFQVLASYFCYINAQPACSLSPGVSGTCIPLDQCSPLLEIVRRRDKTQTDLDLLEKAECGFVGNTLLMCCPDPCKTPDGKQGAFLSINSCPALSNKLETTSKGKKKRRSANAQQDVVCCPQATDVVQVGNCAATVSAFPPDPRTECCGVDGLIGNKIIGGEATAIDQYPWLAIIEYRDNHGEMYLKCGGGLISGRYVLTAAHCVVGKVLNTVTPTNVRLGEYDTRNEGDDCVNLDGGGVDCTEGTVVIGIEKIIAHPRFITTRRGSPDDIALIRLEKTAPYTNFVRPICLPSEDVTFNPPKDLTLFTAGWGAVSNTKSSSNIKQHVDLPFVAKDVCEEAYKSYRKNPMLKTNQMCAGGVPGKDVCKRDSGGPLMYENGNNYEVIGVVSFGLIECGTDVPGVYTKVYEYLPWIMDNIVA